MKSFNLEVEKRKVINAMIHGGAVSKNYAYQLVSNELNAIDPKLLNLYGHFPASPVVQFEVKYILEDAAWKIHAINVTSLAEGDRLTSVARIEEEPESEGDDDATGGSSDESGDESGDEGGDEEPLDMI
jgi:hypothetical protein